MEPSLRSSNQAAAKLQLRRPDPTAHEAIKSFVESCWEDVRISQYADINYASRRLAKEKGYWLDPMPAGRIGYLVFLPRMPIVWIDERLKVSLRLFLRVRSPIYEKKSVFIASLDRTEGLLRLEDCLMLRGVPLRDRPFTQRWDELCDFYGNSFKEDTYAQQGLRVELASYKPLNTATEWSSRPEMPEMMFWQPEVGARRFRIQLTDVPASAAAAAAAAAVVPQSTVPRSTGANTGATVVPHPSYPDTYELSIGGVKRGFAAVQDLALSQQLRIAASAFTQSGGKPNAEKPISVNVEWNADFSMYQILSLVKADGRSA